MVRIMSPLAKCLGWTFLVATLVVPRWAFAQSADEDGADQTAGASDPGAYDVNADADPSALTDFRQALDPYGTWQDDPTYGVIWVPNPTVVGSDFAPYVTGGRWALGDDESWLWVSDYSWGWAPFHYGRWAWIDQRGWGWIPGRVYAPAWVVWRTGYYDDYYVGWAPMPPTWYWRGGFAVGLPFRASVRFAFCPSSQIFAPHVYANVVPAARVGAIAVRTQPYLAASARVGGGYHALDMTRAPSMAAAHIPSSALPAQRVGPDARAMAMARPTPSTFRGTEGLGLSYSSRSASPPTRTFRSSEGLGLSSSMTSRAAFANAGSYRAYGPAYRPSAPTYHSAPVYGSRAFTPAAGTASRSFASSPSFRFNSSFRSSGSSFRAAPTFRSGGARHR